MGSTISPQDVFSGEEDQKIPKYIHMEFLEGIVQSLNYVEIELYTSTRQGRLCRIPQKTAKTRLGLTHTHSLTPLRQTQDYIVRYLSVHSKAQTK